MLLCSVSFRIYSVLVVQYLKKNNNTRSLLSTGEENIYEIGGNQRKGCALVSIVLLPLLETRSFKYADEERKREADNKKGHSSPERNPKGQKEKFQRIH